MPPMQQVTKKCSQNLPKGSKNRAQDAQDAAKVASWSPHGHQNASQDAPKIAKKVLFLLFCMFLVPNAPKSPPGRPRQRNLEQREPPRVPQTPSGPWFQYNFGRFLMKCWRTFCHDLLSLFSFPLLCFALLNWINNQSNNTSTHQAHCWNNTALPARWRVMRST